ncbi:hypothetical protein KCP69_11855 [Salmonella enterica subsp. enterica]|nr:hypothetical protein KCP69_11855 [Salmonella enterica subsp. enterica]
MEDGMGGGFADTDCLHRHRCGGIHRPINSETPHGRRQITPPTVRCRSDFALTSLRLSLAAVSASSPARNIWRGSARPALSCASTEYPSAGDARQFGDRRLYTCAGRRQSRRAYGGGG